MSAKGSDRSRVPPPVGGQESIFRRTDGAEKAILIHLATTRQEKAQAEESMRELKGLTRSAGAEVVHEVYQTRSEISPRFLIGRGKVEEIFRMAEDSQADLVIFDHDLSPIQQRSLEDDIGRKVIDRTQLILDIFSQRAHSSEGKLQVELAQLYYVLPRLSGRGHALSRLGGGIGTRGPGEKKLEEDRRKIQDRIAKIRKEILKVQKRRADQRKSRKNSPIPVVSLVGYTNAGKSTLFNALTREKTYASPMLFATLDPVLRRVTFPDGLYFFLSDTVGFIKNLPAELIASFKATLEEVKQADCICHVIDTTSSSVDKQVEAVEGILSDLGTGNVPIIKVFNKVDLLPDAERILEKNGSTATSTVHVSSRTGGGLDRLKDILRTTLFAKLQVFSLSIPRSKKDLAESFPKWSVVLKRRENGDRLEMKVMAEPGSMLHFMPYIKTGEDNW